MSIESAQFRELLSRWASGVSVVTTNDEGLLYGLTVSSFSSLSLDPPLVLVCLANANRIVEMIRTSGGFAVSILASDQAGASNYFARTGRSPTPDFTEVAGEWTPSGQPVVAHALAWMSCATHALVAHGDHTIAIGQVNGAGFDDSKQPLLYWNRSYRGIGEILPR